MPTVERSFPVTAAPEAVLTYLEDFGNAEAWDPGTQKCERLDEGPIKVGSQWHNVSKIAGITAELTYTLDQRTDDTVRFVGVNDGSTTSDTITVVPHEDGSMLTYEAVIEMKGAAKLASPAMKLVFEKIAGEVVDNLTRELNAL